jgi:DNA polymerase elongation subunit (family B)
MKQILDYACKDRTNEIITYLKTEIEKIKHQYELKDIAFTKGLKKPFEEYIHPGDWVRAAMWTNTHSKFWNAQTNYGAGTKPKYIYVKPSLLPSKYDPIEIVALDDDDQLPEDVVNAIDWDTVIKKTIKAKVETILQAVGIDFDSILQTQTADALNQY